MLTRIYFQFMDMGGFDASHLSDGLRTSSAGKGSPEGSIYLIKNVHKEYNFEAKPEGGEGGTGFEAFINKLTEDARGKDQLDKWKKKPAKLKMDASLRRRRSEYRPTDGQAN